ncbi:DNA mismatch endonuclease Vsr [Candidatus Sumerlaeota bacterium]|nr:DNA mismatch endonuclease Vsr [Candidatus Sumerlaeota bacterium]
MDKISPKRRSENMRQIRSKDTKPEMVVRRLIFSMGFRYRLHRKNLPGKPDLVFAGKKKVIFVHGCFWHQHHLKTCLDSRMPKSNQEYWKPKLMRNVERDKANRKALKKIGWSVLVVWECEIKKCDKLRARLYSFLAN